MALLARDYDVSVATISNLINRKTYRHLATGDHAGDHLTR